MVITSLSWVSESPTPGIHRETISRAFKFRLSLPKMLSGANAFEISNIQEARKSPLNLGLGM